MQKGATFFQTVAAIFLLLCIVFIPFPFHLTGFQQPVTDLIFGRLIEVVSTAVFKLSLKNSAVSSDSGSMYVLVFLLLILSLLISLLFQLFPKWKLYKERIFYFLYILFCYYLVLILLKYGLDKVFKSQFYLPEPNTLYTPLGQVDKDLLYWTSMGTSRFYNIFMGMAEVLAGVLIFFKRTRMAGLLIAAGILLQVVMINFGFDISVKLYSLFLFSLSLYLLNPFYRKLCRFFFTLKDSNTDNVQSTPGLIKNSFAGVFLKCFIGGMILLESFYPYLKDNNFNDDIAKRPYLHGAYEVQQLISGSDTIEIIHAPVKRFFIHRNGYMIFQDQEDRMQDYKFDYDVAANKYVLTDYELMKTELTITYRQTDSILTLQYLKAGKLIQLTGKALDWRKLPVLQKNFHWTVE
ncbi:MAG: hypothetical protein ABL876_05260 [Chitinophagaceae bacterium]